MNIEIQTTNGELKLLTPLFIEGHESKPHEWQFQDKDGKNWLTTIRNDSGFTIIFKETGIATEKEIIQGQLNDYYLNLIESEQSGVEAEDGNDLEDEHSPFDPEKIKVHAKQFNLPLIHYMIEEGDLDLSPDFQRNLVWNSFQKSRLIESVLLRIPLPMFYFSEDNEGRITVVDGLQRLTTIKEFMDNKFPLRNLEYLGETCDGKYFKDEGVKEGLDKKYLRFFNQTQFSVNVIDPSSPPKVKYDIFRRINTGGKPLNNQEIRNCLSGKSLRKALNQMTDSEIFKSATDHSIRRTRMEDHEVALRFILFKRYLEKDGNLEVYKGNMDSALDVLTEELVPAKEEDLSDYVESFLKAMENAEYLFGSKYAFRKIRPQNIGDNKGKKLINKALFLTWSVLLSVLNPAVIKSKNKIGQLLNPLAEEIQNDPQFLKYLSYGTNGRANLLYAFEKGEELIQKHLSL